MNTFSDRILVEVLLLAATLGIISWFVWKDSKGFPPLTGDEEMVTPVGFLVFLLTCIGFVFLAWTGVTGDSSE